MNGGGQGDRAPTPARGRAAATDNDEAGPNVPELMNDLGVDLTLGTVAGFCAGYALKKVRAACDIDAASWCGSV